MTHQEVLDYDKQKRKAGASKVRGALLLGLATAIIALGALYQHHHDARQDQVVKALSTALINQKQDTKTSIEQFENCKDTNSVNNPACQKSAVPTPKPGLQGVPGIRGATGPQGIQGVMGVQGRQGPQGIKGDQGIQGPPAQDGKEGPQGPVGPAGPKGDKGDQGAPGPNCPDGSSSQSRMIATNQGLETLIVCVAG